MTLIGSRPMVGREFTLSGRNDDTHAQRRARPHAIATIAAAALLAVAASGLGSPAQAAGEVNLYSARHYDTDERLYSDFEAATGIKVNRIEDKAEVLVTRIKAEGANSPADILMTADVGRLWAAEAEGIFQSVASEILEDAIPANLREPSGKWFGFSSRARVIFYDKASVTNPPQTYEDLADPKYKGLVCTRTSSNVYMLSMLAAIIAHKGEAAAEAWAKGVWDNRARDPQGGDTDQLSAIVSGECAIALANTYYFARALRTEVRGLSKGADKIGISFPNQSDRGTHVNISGGGVVAHAPNRGNAIKFLEYLASPAAQKYFAEGNDEYPVTTGASISANVTRLGEFKRDQLELAKLGEFQALAQQIYDRVGYR